MTPEEKTEAAVGVVKHLVAWSGYQPTYKDIMSILAEVANGVMANGEIASIVSEGRDTATGRRFRVSITREVIGDTN